MTMLTEHEMTEIQKFIDWKIAHAEALYSWVKGVSGE